MNHPFLFILIVSLLILGVFVINQVTLAQNVTNQSIPIGPNVSVLFSANSTGFDPLTQQGTLMMVGQVMNTGNETSENTNVTTDLLDFNGTLAGFNSVQTVPATIPPNGTANFQTRFTDQDVIGGTGNVLFYQQTPDNGGATSKFLGFIPPPFFAGTGAALAGAGVPLGTGAGFATGGGGVGGGFATGGGSSGGGGGGGTTIIKQVTNNIKQCIQNQANVANDVGGDVGQSNKAICNIDGVIIQLSEPTTPVTLPPSVTPVVGEPGGPANDDGSCNDGQEPVDNVCPPNASLKTLDVPPQQAADQVVTKPTPPIENSTSPIENSTSPDNRLSLALEPEPDCGNDGELVNGECVPFGCTSDNPPSSCPDTTAQLAAEPSTDEPITDEQEDQEQAVESNDNGNSDENSNDDENSN